MKRNGVSIKIIFIYTVIAIFFHSCKKDPEINPEIAHPVLPNVIIVVMDGLRYTDTGKDSLFDQLKFFKKNILPGGSIHTSFYNQVFPLTNPGHCALTTGYYQNIDNFGNETPLLPSIFHYLRKQKGLPSYKTWIISSKGKLHVLSQTQNVNWEKYNPRTYCGAHNDHVSYGEDEQTLMAAKSILRTYHPNLVLLSFKEPDVAGHSGNRLLYEEKIRSTDSLLYDFWRFVYEDPVYKHNTFFFLTSDHGRHSDSVAGGFAHHGDTCEGCRHIIFYAQGPGVKKNNRLNGVERELIDLAPTVQKIFGLKETHFKGNVMDELFVD